MFGGCKLYSTYFLLLQFFNKIFVPNFLELNEIKWENASTEREISVQIIRPFIKRNEKENYVFIIISHLDNSF